VVQVATNTSHVTDVFSTSDFRLHSKLPFKLPSLTSLVNRTIQSSRNPSHGSSLIREGFGVSKSPDFPDNGEYLRYLRRSWSPSHSQVLAF